MTDADRAQAAERLLNDPAVKAIWVEIEAGAIEAMLDAPDDISRRFHRDTVKTIRELRRGLQAHITAHQEATKSRQGYA